VPRGIALNLLASALTILAAIALVSSAMLVNQGTIAAPLPTNSSQVAEAFYAAVNEAMRSGNLTPLDAVIAPDIMVHGLPVGHSADRAGFLQYLAALRVITPDLRLQVERIAVAGDTAMSQLVSPEGKGGFAGLRIADGPSWGGYDAFRIVNGRVAELWRGSDTPVWLQPLAQETFDPLTIVRMATWERLASPAGNDWEQGPFFDQRVVFVISGSMSVRFDAGPRSVMPAVRRDRAPAASVLPEKIITLEAGDVLAIPAGARYLLGGNDPDSNFLAYVLALGTFGYDGPLQPETRSTQSFGSTAEPHDRFSRTLLAATLFPAVAQGLLTASLGRVILQPGASVRFHGVDGLLLLIAESGAPALVTPDPAFTRSQPAEMDQRDAVLDRLQSDHAQVIAPGHPSSLINLGDVAGEILILTVMPHAEATSRAPA
jgi:hypothetical protein